MTSFANDDGTPMRRAPDGDLVPDLTDEQRKADAIRRCREAINHTHQENQ